MFCLNDKFLSSGKCTFNLSTLTMMDIYAFSSDAFALSTSCNVNWIFENVDTGYNENTSFTWKISRKRMESMQVSKKLTPITLKLSNCFVLFSHFQVKRRMQSTSKRILQVDEKLLKIPHIVLTPWWYLWFQMASHSDFPLSWTTFIWDIAARSKLVD